MRELTQLLAQARAPIALREVTPLLAAAKPLIAIVEQRQSPVFALRELSQLVAQLIQAQRRRAPPALRELTRLVTQARATIALPEVTRLKDRANRIHALVSQTPVYALRELGQLVAEVTQAERRRAPIALQELTRLVAQARAPIALLTDSRLLAEPTQVKRLIATLAEQALLVAPLFTAAARRPHFPGVGLEKVLAAPAIRVHSVLPRRFFSNMSWQYVLAIRCR